MDKEAFSMLWTINSISCTHACGYSTGLKMISLGRAWTINNIAYNCNKLIISEYNVEEIQMSFKFLAYICTCHEHPPHIDAIHNLETGLQLLL